MAQRNLKAQGLVSACSLIFNFLRGSYVDGLSQVVTVTDLLRGAKLPRNDVWAAFRIIIQMPILRNHLVHPSESHASVEPSENILRYNSFEGFLKRIQEDAERQNSIIRETAKLPKNPNRSAQKKYLLHSSKENWEAIENEFDETKKSFGRKINFVSDSYKRLIIFRDVEQAFILAKSGFSE